MVTSCTGGDRVLLFGSLDRHLSMDTLAASLAPPTRDWHGLAWCYGLPGSVQSVPFCSPGMALADASVARTCSHLSGPESFTDFRSSPASLQEVQLTAYLVVALLREAACFTFWSSFSYYVLLRDRRR